MDPLKTIQKLQKKYPHSKSHITTKNPFLTYIAAVLSAQCTDERVAIVTNELFKKYKKPEDYVKLPLPKLERLIRSTGFYKNKAKRIKETARIIVKKYKGKFPDDMQSILSLPGVARKTANVILQNAFNKIEGIVVDTHVIRLAQRMGFSKNTNPEKIEKDLMNIFPKRYWKKIPALFKALGRDVCKARCADCKNCILQKECPKIGVKKFC